MKVAFITRSTLYQVQGGGAVQVLETAAHLRELGISVNIFLSHEKINYAEFDLLHFFDIIRPANILYHINKSNKPFVVSPVLVDYSEYDRHHRNGFGGMVLRHFPASAGEYVKTVTRWILQRDKLKSKAYLWKGQRHAIREILQQTKMVLPNSMSEYKRLQELYQIGFPFSIVPNGINEKMFLPDTKTVKNEKLVICAARIEGIKNQYNLVKALNNTPFRLLLIGDPAPNQKSYYHLCKKTAAPNIEFIKNISQQELAAYYQKAKVHVLPSWFETCGLASLEAAAMGCSIVVSDKGFTRDYFANSVFYCNPADPSSIYQAIEKAAADNNAGKLQEKVFQQYTWSKAATTTLAAYKKIIPHACQLPAV